MESHKGVFFNLYISLSIIIHWGINQIYDMDDHHFHADNGEDPLRQEKNNIKINHEWR